MQELNRVISLNLLWLGFACTGPKTQPDTSVSIDETGQIDACVNTFPVTPMPDRQLTEYGTEVPTLESVLPDRLSESELYADISTGEVHPSIQWFQPNMNCSLMVRARIVGLHSRV